MAKGMAAREEPRHGRSSCVCYFGVCILSGERPLVFGPGLSRMTRTGGDPLILPLQVNAKVYLTFFEPRR
jgi:hypothetical protein